MNDPVYQQYVISDTASAVQNLGFEWYPETWRQAELLEVYVNALARETAQGLFYSCGCDVTFGELNNNLPIMEVASINFAPIINGSTLRVQHWQSWKGSITLDGGKQYGFTGNATPLFVLITPANWEFIVSIHWKIRILA